MKHLYEFSIFNKKSHCTADKCRPSDGKEQDVMQMESELDPQKLKDCGYIVDSTIHGRIYLKSENDEYAVYIYPPNEDGKYRFEIDTDLYATFPPTIKQGKTVDVNRILDLSCKDYNVNLDEL
jgi:hypothetical protein